MLVASVGSPTNCQLLPLLSVHRRPLRLLKLGVDADRCPGCQAAAGPPGIRVYVRQLRLPGVHTKFVGYHRKVIIGMTAELRSGGPIPAAADDDVDPEAPLSLVLSPWWAKPPPDSGGTLRRA